ncbi:MAG TPA: hypothetical protein VID27_00025 [Blastocatellia bacterium]|jgi:hypothetical protein
MRRSTQSAFLAVTLFAILLACGCGQGTANEQKPTSTSPAPAADNKASGNKIGVAACDEYLTKMEACLSSKKVPDTVKEAYRNSFEQYREAWKKAAADPAGKAALEQGCQSALTAAKQFFDTCN